MKKQLLVSALALNALLGLGMTGYSQLYTSTGTASINSGTLSNTGPTSYFVTGQGEQQCGTIRDGTLTFVPCSSLVSDSRAPTHAFFHQVVDVFYDILGNKIETRSETHEVAYNCHNGIRNQAPAIAASDDGKGNVQFANLLLPGEPDPSIPPPSAQTRLAAFKAAAGIHDLDTAQAFAEARKIGPIPKSKDEGMTPTIVGKTTNLAAK